jgi:hypothetical protein
MKNSFPLSTIFLLLFFCTSLKGQTCDTVDVNHFGELITDSTVTVYWNSVVGTDAYYFRYRVTNGGFDFSNPIFTSVNAILLTSLLPGTEYEYAVQSICGVDTSAFSSSGFFTTNAAPLLPEIARGPYMTISTSSSVTIQWAFNHSHSAEVKYGTTVGNLSSSVIDTIISRKHSVLLENLQPNTKYYYSIGKIGIPIQLSSNNFFYTAPLDNDTVPLKFWATGDFGTGTSPQENVRNAFQNYTTGQKIDGWIWLGDNAYSTGTDQEYQDKVFDVYPNQLQNIPLFPALGNHDYAQSGYLSTASRTTNFPYFSIFTLPTGSGTEKYYSTNYGNVHFIALDSYGSYNSPSSTMYNWLISDLINNTQQWTIAYFHHPPYSKGSHDSDDSDELVDMRNNIVPLLESYGVDLVLSGHSHSYERSFFINGHYGDENTFDSTYLVQSGGGPYHKLTRNSAGTVYVVCGVSGKISSTSPGYPHRAMYASTVSEYGSMLIDVTGTSLTASFLTSGGIIEDSFTITKPLNIINTVNPVVNENSEVSIFPNPANNEFNIYFGELKNDEYNIKIQNAIGQNIFEKTYSVGGKNNFITLNRGILNDCQPGMYFISITNDNKTITKSLVIE